MHGSLEDRSLNFLAITKFDFNLDEHMKSRKQLFNLETIVTMGL